jgi:hypothetical protein
MQSDIHGQYSSLVAGIANTSEMINKGEEMNADLKSYMTLS